MDDLKKAEQGRKESDLPDESFAVSLYLEGEGFAEAEEVARKISSTFESYPHWAQSTRQEREVRVAILKTLRESSPDRTDVKKMVRLTDGVMAMLRRAFA